MRRNWRWSRLVSATANLGMPACPLPGGAAVDIALVVGAVDNALSGCLFTEK
jgi:hypothetical protein